MIPRALVYVPDAEAGAGARAVVGGRPVLVRLLLAAQRAGVERVALPGAARAWGLPADPRLRTLVVWLDELDGTERASWQDGPLLLLPPTVLVDLRGLRTLLAETPGPGACAVAETKGLASPVLLAPPELVRPLWDRLAAGLPVGEDLEAAVRRQATRWVPAGGLCAPVTGAAQRADAESGLYASLGIAADSVVDRLVHRRVSRALTRRLVRLRITPNAVTLASLLAGITATWLLWGATPLSACLGVVAYALAVVLDHADGEVARVTFQESPRGARLDLAVDGLVQALVMLALGVTAGRVGGWPAVVAGIVAAAGAMLSAVCAARFGVGPGRHAGAGGALDRLGNRDFVYLVLAIFVAGVWLVPAILPPLVMLLAIGSQAFWLGCLVSRRRGRLALAVAFAGATGVGPAAATELPVTYAGDIPCADCPGQRLTVTLFPDGAFRLRQTYRSVAAGQDRHFYDLGRWAHDAADVARLVLRGGTEAPRRFAWKDPAVLRMLDNEGREIRSAPNYDLTRQPTVDPVAGPMRLRGLYVFLADAGSFTECLTGARYPVLPGDAHAALERAYLGAPHAPGAPVLAAVEGAVRGARPPRRRAVRSSVAGRGMRGIGGTRLAARHRLGRG